MNGKKAQSYCRAPCPGRARMLFMRVIEFALSFTTKPDQQKRAFSWMAEPLHRYNIASMGVTLGVTPIFKKPKPLCHKRLHHLFD